MEFLLYLLSVLCVPFLRFFFVRLFVRTSVALFLNHVSHAICIIIDLTNTKNWPATERKSGFLRVECLILFHNEIIQIDTEEL